MPSKIDQFFSHRDRFGNGRALYVVALLAFLMPLTLSALRGLRMDNEVERWLPDEDREARVLAWHHGNFPQGDQLLITWDGSSLNDSRVEAFALGLLGTTDELGIRRGGTELVASVVTARDVLTQMIEGHVEPDEAVLRLQGTLLGTGPLRVRLKSDHDNEQARQELIALASNVLGRQVTAGPAAIGSALQESESGEAAPLDTDEIEEDLISEVATVSEHHLTLRWDQLSRSSEETARALTAINAAPAVEEAFFEGGSPVAVLVALSDAGVAERPTVIETIRTVAVDSGIDLSHLRIGGSPAASVALNQGARTASWNTKYPIWNLPFRSPFLMSAILGGVIALAALRSFRLGVLVLGVSYATTLMAVACVPIAGDSMNMVLVVMPTLLTVLTLSGAIHVANYWKHEAHLAPAGAVGRAVRQAFMPCVLASFTTAVGLMSLMNSTLTPVRQFGFYSAIGCGIALVMVLCGLPSLLQLWQGSGKRQEINEEMRWTRFGGWLGRYWGPTALLSIVAAAVATSGLAYFRTETKVIRYFPQDADIVRDYHAIEGTLAGISPVDIVVRFDAEAQANTDFLERLELVRSAATALASHQEVTGTLSLADFQPITERPAERASTFQKIRFNQKVRRIEQEAKSGRGAAFLAVAESPTDLIGADGRTLSDPGDELWRIAAQAAVMTDAEYSELIAALDTLVATELDKCAGAGHVVTGMVPLFMRTQEAVLESLIRSFGLAFVVIAVVLMVLLRSFLGGLVAMVPNFVPVGVVFGLVSWAGQRVDIGTMITASVALGVAVDGTLHLLTWFQRGLNSGLNRQRAMSTALGHCGPAMWQTSAAVGLCLLALMPAELLLISRFGWLMAALIGAALVADVIMLPALLAGPLGMLLERRYKGSKPPAPQATTTERPRFVPQPHLLQNSGRSEAAARIRRSA